MREVGTLGARDKIEDSQIETQRIRDNIGDSEIGSPRIRDNIGDIGSQISDKLRDSVIGSLQIRDNIGNSAIGSLQIRDNIEDSEFFTLRIEDKIKEHSAYSELQSGDVYAKSFNHDLKISSFLQSEEVNEKIDTKEVAFYSEGKGLPSEHLLKENDQNKVKEKNILLLVENITLDTTWDPEEYSQGKYNFLAFILICLSLSLSLNLPFTFTLTHTHTLSLSSLD